MSQPLRILLIEDNRDDVFAFNWALKKTGLELQTDVVTDGQQAIDYLSGAGDYANREASPLPDLAFLDLKLPYRNGMEILTWIREQPEIRDLKVVILSGSDEPRDRANTAALGALRYIVKPANPLDLRETLQDCELGSDASAANKPSTT